MKKMTCRQMGGACDAVITGATPQEMGDSCQKHVMQVKAAGDTSHDEAMAKMSKMTPAELQAFMGDFVRKFEQAEEA